MNSFVSDDVVDILPLYALVLTMIVTLCLNQDYSSFLFGNGSLGIVSTLLQVSVVAVLVQYYPQRSFVSVIVCYYVLHTVLWGPIGRHNK